MDRGRVQAPIKDFSVDKLSLLQVTLLWARRVRLGEKALARQNKLLRLGRLPPPPRA